MDIDAMNTQNLAFYARSILVLYSRHTRYMLGGKMIVRMYNSLRCNAINEYIHAHRHAVFALFMQGFILALCSLPSATGSWPTTTSRGRWPSPTT